jgi:hypothetical protein
MFSVRKGMDLPETIYNIQQFVASGKLDLDLVSLLFASMDRIDQKRKEAQLEASGGYKSFRMHSIKL